MSIKIKANLTTIRRYNVHPCRVHGVVYASILAASKATGEAYRVIRKKLFEGKRGYKLLPYDGFYPRKGADKGLDPHIYVEGGWYYSQREAAEAIGVSAGTLHNRIHDPNYLDYFVLL